MRFVLRGEDMVGEPQHRGVARRQPRIRQRRRRPPPLRKPLFKPLSCCRAGVKGVRTIKSAASAAIPSCTSQSSAATSAGSRSTLGAHAGASPRLSRQPPLFSATKLSSWM